jgi:isopenicillin-N epimerase
VLAGLLHTQLDRLVLLDNATFAMNAVAASTPLEPGDEVLLTDHEYGAVRNIWQARCRAAGDALGPSSHCRSRQIRTPLWRPSPQP